MKFMTVTMLTSAASDGVLVVQIHRAPHLWFNFLYYFKALYFEILKNYGSNF